MQKLLRLTPFLLLLFLASTTSKAWSQSYAISSIPYNPDPFAAGTPATPSFDDFYGPATALPFSFCFGGVAHDSIVIGTNGIVTFDRSVANTGCPWAINSALPNATLPAFSILTPWQDIDPALGGGIYIGVYGTAPYRRAVISYDQVPMFSCNTLVFSQQVILYESTNIVEIHVQNKPLCPTWNGGAAILGYQNGISDYASPPGYDYPTQWTASNQAWRFSPLLSPCYFLPESDTISGRVYMDLNTNCTQDGGDFPITVAAVIANGGQFYDWTDANGDYSIITDQGVYTVTHYVPGTVTPVCPSGGSHTVSFAGYGIHSMNNDFADTVNMACSDLSVDIGTFNMTACLSETATLNWCNTSWLTDTSVTITITLDDSLTLTGASIPYTPLGGNSFSFNIGTLGPFDCGSATLLLDVGCDSLGTIYCMNATIAGATFDCDTLNNTAQDCHALVGSYDPNDKRVAAQDQSGYVTHDTIDPTDRLTYMIRFQNTGTDTAFTVTLRDVLDSRLDPATVVMGASSHQYRYFVAGALLLIEFDNILLPDSNTNLQGSIGWVKFTIAQKPGNGPGDIIRNSTAIYFDQNSPIITNTTENVLRLPVSVVRPFLTNVEVFPNPGQDRIIIQWQSQGDAQFELVNLIGQVVATQPITDDRTEISLPGLQPGIYLWRLKQDRHILATGKWLRD